MRTARIDRSWLKKFLGVVTFLISVYNSDGQLYVNNPEDFFMPAKGYIARFAEDRPVIDGKINDAVWEQAAWSDYFQDIEGEKKPMPSFGTRVKMLWNDSCLFVAASMEEPHVWATLTKHDAIVYHDNDFEVFIDPDNDTHQYFEIEVNALNTIFDLFLPKPYRNGGNALISYETAFLQSAVNIQGTINKPTDKDSGWTVEMAIPFSSLTLGNIWKSPEEGTLWRINFSRVQWDVENSNGIYRKKKNNQGKNLPEHNWVWSPQGIINMHYPERWGYLQFTRNYGTSKLFTLPYREKQRQYLWIIYYQQKKYFSRYGRYANSINELGWNKGSLEVEGTINSIKVEVTSQQFTAYISDQNNAWSINDEGYVKQVKRMP